MSQMKKQNSVDSLYIHIPFCSNICPYCDFPKLLNVGDFESKYIDSLLKEINSKPHRKYKTIYIGGGTPTCLSLLNLEKLLLVLSNQLQKNYEFTIETNVESLDQSKIDLLKTHGVNRISIGVQSLNDECLKFLGRKHTADSVIKLISLLHKNEFENINIDLIYGFDLLSDEILINTINKYLELGIQHISTYPLTIESGTIFYLNNINDSNDENVSRQYALIQRILFDNGFEQYEVSNFSLNKKYTSKHNLTYWNNNFYDGAGLGSAYYLPSVDSQFSGIRYANTKSLSSYNEGDYISSKEYISLEEEKKYFLMTNLRLTEGFSLKKYYEKFGIDFLDEYETILKKHIQNNNIKIIQDKVYIPKDKLFLMNYVLSDLI